MSTTDLIADPGGGTYEELQQLGLVRHSPSQVGLMPALTIHQAVERYNMLVEFTRTVMVKDQDYGTIEGVSKPCLYKAGAEKLCTLFGLSPKFELIERVEDWTGRDHNSEPFFFYFYKCILLRGGEVVGEADGSCNSWEKKYRYRGGSRKCPECGKEALIKGKPEFEKDPRFKGGYFCYGKKGGCGAKFAPKDPAIEGQDIAQVPNPDIAEQVNTIQKMAQKRALVAAVLIVTNASAFYTQDMEDLRTIDADFEDVTETSEQVRERRIKEETAKKAAHQPASHGPATPPEVITELADFLNSPPDEPLAGLEQRQAAKDAEAQAVLKDAAASKPSPKKAVIPVSADMLKAFGEIKRQLSGIEGTDETYYRTLRVPPPNRPASEPPWEGYAKSNQIKTREEGTRVYKLLVSELNLLQQKRETLAEIEERAKKIGPNRFAAFIRDTMKLDDQQFEHASGEKLLSVLEVMRELQYGD